MGKYKVIIVDDDEVSLESLSFELQKDTRFSLEGTARNGKKGKKLITKMTSERPSSVTLHPCRVFP